MAYSHLILYVWDISVLLNKAEQEFDNKNVSAGRNLQHNDSDMRAREGMMVFEVNVYAMLEIDTDSYQHLLNNTICCKIWSTSGVPKVHSSVVKCERKPNTNVNTKSRSTVGYLSSW